MVVFVDLDDESEPPEDPRLKIIWDVNGHAGIVGRFGPGNSVPGKEMKSADEAEKRENPNKTPFTEALGCYP